MKPQLIIAFAHLTEAGFYAKAKHIDDCLHSRNCGVFFPQPWPATIPSLAELHKTVVGYEAARLEASAGDAKKAELLAILRPALTRLLVRLAPYIEIVSGNNVVMLASSGYDVFTSAGVGRGFNQEPQEDGTTLPAPGL